MSDPDKTFPLIDKVSAEALAGMDSPDFLVQFHQLAAQAKEVGAKVAEVTLHWDNYKPGEIINGRYVPELVLRVRAVDD